MAKPIRELKRPPALHLAVQEAIKDYIIENGLQPGDALPPETELASSLGVSRNSLREATKALESLGVVETRHGTGLFVRAFSFDPLLENLLYGTLFDLQELEDLHSVRCALESGMIGDALGAITEKDLAELRRLTETMRARAEQGDAFPEEDRHFHRVLFEPLGNQVLLKLLDAFWLAFHKVGEGANIRDRDPMRTYENHAEILKAVTARDVERARTLVVQHHADLKARLRQARQQQGVPLGS